MKINKLYTLGFSVFLLLTLLVVSCSKEDDNNSNLEASHMKRFEESVLLKSDLPVSLSSTSKKNADTNESYITFKIENYDNEFVLRPVYVIDGVDFVDTGDFNDRVAGDGIYTSLQSEVLSNAKKSSKSKIVMSDEFKFKNKLTTNMVEIDCKFRMTYKGKSSWFGNSCSGGCIELYDCHFKVEF
jgi:hypothetical protein